MTFNEKVIVSQNLKDLMKIAKILIKDGYLVQLRYEDCGNYTLEYEQTELDLASGCYVYMTQDEYDEYYSQTVSDDGDELDKEADGNEEETADDNKGSYSRGYQDGWAKGYQKRVDEETADDYDRDNNGIYNEGYEDGYSNGYEEGYDDGYEKGYNDGLSDLAYDDDDEC